MPRWVRYFIALNTGKTLKESGTEKRKLKETLLWEDKGISKEGMCHLEIFQWRGKIKIKSGEKSKDTAQIKKTHRTNPNLPPSMKSLWKSLWKSTTTETNKKMLLTKNIAHAMPKIRKIKIEKNNNKKAKFYIQLKGEKSIRKWELEQATGFHSSSNNNAAEENYDVALQTE